MNSISEAYEENHAFWWTLDGIAEGQDRSVNQNFYWTHHPDKRWASWHKIRLTAEDIKEEIRSRIKTCIDSDSEIHAHLSNNTQPENLNRQLLDAGFQHLRRYPIYYIQTEALTPDTAQMDWKRFSGNGADLQSLHSFAGTRKIYTVDYLELLQSRMQAADGRITHHVSYKDEVPFAAFTLIRSDNLLCFYDPLSKSFSDRQRAGMLRSAAAIAREEACDYLALICDRELEPVLNDLKFQTEGWISWFHLSRKKLNKFAE